MRSYGEAVERKCLAAGTSRERRRRDKKKKGELGETEVEQWRGIDSRRVAICVVCWSQLLGFRLLSQAQGARCHQSAPIFNAGVDDVHGLLF